ncbi:MAG TPA: hypothetical protein VF804_07715 [Holophagaceae bacterium]
METIQYSQIDLASEQLDSALKLFMAKTPRFASALTLAGAAEEILGKTLEHQGKTSAMRHWYLGKINNCTGCKPLPTWQQHASEENFARNILKHVHDVKVIAIPFGLEDAAAMMLYRAITNYEWLGLNKSWRMGKFERWFLKWAS